MFKASPLLSFSETERSPSSIRAGALVFTDPKSKALKQQLESLAPRQIPLLIEGEQGTGKELLARYVHQCSGRTGLFVAVSGTSISMSHGEAELFGHVAGVPSNPLSSRAGWFGSAHNGTLYLEEIADLSLALQRRLLTALQEGTVTRVGSSAASKVDVHLVASTSFNLEYAVQAGSLLSELFELLQAGYLALPALRARPADILPLAQYFLDYYCQRRNAPSVKISKSACQVLQTQPWPGNTRELENCMHFALLVCNGPEIQPQHLYLPHGISQ